MTSLIGGCTDDDAPASADAPSGACKHLYIGHSREQALVHGSFKASKVEAAPGPTGVLVRVTRSTVWSDQDELDPDGCTRLVLSGDGTYHFRATAPAARPGCSWIDTDTRDFRGPGFLEVALVLQNTCEGSPRPAQR